MRSTSSFLAASILMATPAYGQDWVAPKQAFGLGLGETTGYGLLYQRSFTDGWRGRLSAGVIPYGGPALGAGVLRDVGSLGGARVYVVGAGLYKQVAINEVHYSFTPAVGFQWGPMMLETGITSFSTDRWNPGASGRYVTWGYALAVGLGLVSEF